MHGGAISVIFIELEGNVSFQGVLYMILSILI